MMQKKKQARVLHVVTSMTQTGGVGRLLMDLNSNIDQEKLRFDFLSLSHGDLQECNEAMAAIGVSLYCIPNLSSSGLFAFIRNIRNVILAHGPYEAVHLHIYHLSGIAAWVAKRAGIKNVITHSHGTQYEGRNRNNFLFGPFFLLSQWLIRANSTVFIACTRDAGRALFGPKIVRSEKFSLLMNAIDIRKFKSSSAIEIAKTKFNYAICKESLVIGHIGRLSYAKNQMRLVEIFYEIVKEREDAVLVVIGVGGLEGELKKMVNSKTIADRVFFVGAQDNIPGWLSIFDVFVLPSLFEGLGIVNIEAQAMSIPCVVSDAIPAEADLCVGLLKFVSLKKSSREWAEIVLKAANMVRPPLDVIRKALHAKGYDIKYVAKQLERLYGLETEGAACVTIEEML